MIFLLQKDCVRGTKGLRVLSDGNSLIPTFCVGLIELVVSTVARLIAVRVLPVALSVRTFARRSPQQSALIGMTPARSLVAVSL